LSYAAFTLTAKGHEVLDPTEIPLPQDVVPAVAVGVVVGVGVLAVLAEVVLVVVTVPGVVTVLVDCDGDAFLITVVVPLLPQPATAVTSAPTNIEMVMICFINLAAGPGGPAREPGRLMAKVLSLGRESTSGTDPSSLPSQNQTTRFKRFV
jgi:hypothetical protein